MKYRDYYEILGVPRGVSQKEIQTAYRKLARKLHPDVNKEPGAEERFKEINEAYEVLKDEEKRKKYDSLGKDWRNGEAYSPPPGWENVIFDFGSGGGGFQTGDVGGFSDFFESLFGQGRTGRTRRAAGGGWSMRGSDQEAELGLTLEEAYHGGKKTIRLDRLEAGPDGGYSPTAKEYTINIPVGVSDGSRIRLAGQGNPGQGGGSPGDLYLKVRLLPHSLFTVDGTDLNTRLVVTPWEAALGSKVEVATLSGKVNMTLPPGIQSGQKLRVKGKGLPGKAGEHGNLYVKIEINVPKELSPREKELFEELAKVSDFNPRAEGRRV
ncbi:MAG: DnaJ C-terminal domain-containing protein [Chitinophagales bacterium]